MLRPLPDLQDEEAMTKLGRLSAIRNAKLDALHLLRDCAVRLQSQQGDEIQDIQLARTALDRLEELSKL